MFFEQGIMYLLYLLPHPQYHELQLPDSSKYSVQVPSVLGRGLEGKLSDESGTWTGPSIYTPSNLDDLPSRDLAQAPGNPFLPTTPKGR
jgi:hypothetical protein